MEKGGEGKRIAQDNSALFFPGSVYKKYPQGKGLRRTRSSIELPRKDTVCSSQEVLCCLYQHVPPKQSFLPPTVISGKVDILGIETKSA